MLVYAMYSRSPRVSIFQRVDRMNNCGGGGYVAERCELASVEPSDSRMIYFLVLWVNCWKSLVCVYGDLFGFGAESC